MEIIINIYCNDIVKSVKYYCEGIGEFKLINESTKSAILEFKQNKNIIFNLLPKESNHSTLAEISLQVTSAEKLFNYMKEQSMVDYGIVEGAYLAGKQKITFLTAPIGDYFYTVDPNGNKIQFFDKSNLE
jgi:hypothetical protein